MASRPHRAEVFGWVDDQTDEATGAPGFWTSTGDAPEAAPAGYDEFPAEPTGSLPDFELERSTDEVTRGTHLRLISGWHPRPALPELPPVDYALLQPVDEAPRPATPPPAPPRLVVVHALTPGAPEERSRAAAMVASPRPAGPIVHPLIRQRDELEVTEADVPELSLDPATEEAARAEELPQRGRAAEINAMAFGMSWLAAFSGGLLASTTAIALCVATARLVVGAV